MKIPNLYDAGYHASYSAKANYSQVIIQLACDKFYCNELQ